MKLVYLAGPYRSDTEFGVHKNIQAAERLAIEVWRLGAACICPQKNTAYFGGVLPDSVWLDGDIEIMWRCDAMLMAPGWERSKGSTREKSIAEDVGIPVFVHLDEVRDWVQS